LGSCICAQNAFHLDLRAWRWRSTGRGIGEDDNAVAELGRAGELEFQVSGVDTLKKALAASDDQGEERKMELIDEVVLYQGAVELARPVLHNVLTGPLLQVGNFLGDVTFDECGVPCSLP
jgi:hypothetical protein